MRDSGFNRAGRVTGRAGGCIACRSDEVNIVVVAGALWVLVVRSAMSTSTEHIGEYVDDDLSFAGELDADSSDSGGVIVKREVSKDLLSSPFVRRRGSEAGSSLLNGLRPSISMPRGFCGMD